MKRIHLLYATIALLIVVVYFNRERFGSTDINMSQEPVVVGPNRKNVTCGDGTNAEEGQCSLDSKSGGMQLLPY